MSIEGLPVIYIASALLVLLLVIVTVQMVYIVKNGRTLAAKVIENAELLSQFVASSTRADTVERQNERYTTIIVERDVDIEKHRFTTQGLQSKLDIAQTELRSEVNRNTELVTRWSDVKAEKEAAVSELGSLRVAFAEMKTKMNDNVENFEEQRKQFSETKDAMTKDFENVANRIFENKGKIFSESSQQSLDTLLKPFKDQIEGFQKRVNEVHDSSVRDSTQLAAEIKKVLDVGLKMSDEANNLSSTLKGNSQQRGAWGEAQLERTLEMSGLIEAEHYEKQSSFKSDDGRTKLTDYLIKLPDNKHIVIDSKVTMVAYDKAVNAETDELHMLAMKEHLNAIRRHIDELSAKDYTNLIGIESPSFVLMFMPIEPAYIDALKANRDLFEYGYAKGIILVSHTTLIPILRTISNLWTIDRSNKEAREVSEKAGDIYNSVCMVAERVQKLGNTLTTANTHYNSTVRALTGNQGLFGKVERFNTLSTKVSKLLPSIDESHLEHETDRLTLAVEAIKDAEPVDASLTAPMSVSELRLDPTTDVPDEVVTSPTLTDEEARLEEQANNELDG